MEECGGDGGAIHAPFDHGAGDRQRMRDVRFARDARLARVGMRREGVRVLYAPYVGRGKIIETIDEDPVGRILAGGRVR